MSTTQLVQNVAVMNAPVPKIIIKDLESDGEVEQAEQAAKAYRWRPTGKKWRPMTKPKSLWT